MNRPCPDSHPPHPATGRVGHVVRFAAAGAPINPLLFLGGPADAGLTEPGELQLGHPSYGSSHRPVESANHCGAA